MSLKNYKIYFFTLSFIDYSVFQVGNSWLDLLDSINYVFIIKLRFYYRVFGVSSI